MSIKEVIMRRDGISEIEAQNLINDCRAEVLMCAAEGNYEDAELAVMDYLGLEPDYLMELI